MEKTEKDLGFLYMKARSYNFKTNETINIQESKLSSELLTAEEALKDIDRSKDNLIENKHATEKRASWYHGPMAVECVFYWVANPRKYLFDSLIITVKAK